MPTQTHPHKQKPFYNLSVAEALKRLKASAKGLTKSQATARLKAHGPNKLPSGKKITGMSIFFAQFKNSLILILLAALMVSIFFNEHSDALIIGIAIGVNVIFGFIQEFKAQKAFSALAQMITYDARVMRSRAIQTIPAGELVPGDIVLLSPGDRIPADARIISAQDLLINESPLTGESASVKKNTRVIKGEKILAERTNMVYRGTTIANGSATVAVCATGRKSEIGKIAASLQDIALQDSPLQKKIKGLSRFLGLIILILALLIFVTGILSGADFEEMLITAVAVAVAALPEGLVVALTVILAIGMQRILKQKALVRKLLAAETLGSTTIICTDKTGTLTRGKMAVEKIITSSGTTSVHGSQVREKSQELIKALEIAALCNNAYIERDEKTKENTIKASPTESALFSAALHAGVDIDQLQRKYRRIDEIPFTSEIKFMATLHSVQDKRHREILIKGAPEKLLEHISHAYRKGKVMKLTKKEHTELGRSIEELTRSGYRVLVGGFKDFTDQNRFPEIEEGNYDELFSGLIFAGFYCLRDPLRKDVKHTLALTRRAGIRTIMITGDHKQTATAIARELKLIKDDTQVMEGETLHALQEEELAAAIKTTQVFARVTPEDKLHLVRILKEQGEIVAMTGDGVNDAPALLRADIGVALGSGTDVAKGAADLVLLNNNFSVIVRAIAEGRVIFTNIQTVALYLLSDSFSEIILIMGSILLGTFSVVFGDLPLPITAAQILWINIISDGFPAFALTLEPPNKGVMNEPPRDPTAPILTKEIKLLIGLISMSTGIMVLGVFIYFSQIASIDLARSVVFASLGINSVLYVFSVRSLHQSAYSRIFFQNPWLLISVGIGLILQISPFYIPGLGAFLDLTPLGAFHWTIILAQSVIVIFLIEFVKWWYNRRK